MNKKQKGEIERMDERVETCNLGGKGGGDKPVD